MRTNGDKMQSVSQYDVRLVLMLTLVDLAEAVEGQRAAPT